LFAIFVFNLLFLKYSSSTSVLKHESALYLWNRAGENARIRYREGVKNLTSFASTNPFLDGVIPVAYGEDVLSCCPSFVATL
jgi:hypothetical protein